MTWEMVDFENGQIELPADVMKMGQPHIVPLTRQAQRILENLHHITVRRHIKLDIKAA
ncbi:MAG: hypothetical protein ABJ327_04640 [Litoreibacter sp.]